MQSTKPVDNRPSWLGTSLDYNQMLRQAYWNCVNSLQGFQAESVGGMAGIPSRFQAKVAWDRFEGNVSILQQMILKDDKDEEYEKAMTPNIVNRRVDEFYDRVCEHDQEEEDCDCKVESFTVERPALERFGAITALFDRKNLLKKAGVIEGHL